MACAEISQSVDVEVPATMTVEIVLSLIAGIIIGLIFIIILLIIRFRKIIIKKINDCCCKNYFCVVCCCCCCGLLGRDRKKKDHNTYLISSWEEPEGPANETEGGVEEETEQEEQSLVLSNPRFTLDVGEADEGGDVAVVTDERKETLPLAPVEQSSSAETRRKSFDHKGTAETSFISVSSVDAKFSDSLAELTDRPSFADILVAPREQRHDILHGCEKRSIAKLESSFVQSCTEFLLLRAEVLSSDLVTAELVSEECKSRLMEVCRGCVAQTGGGSLDSEGDRLNLNAIATQVFDKLRAGLKEEENISAVKAEELMTGFERDVGQFEMLVSTIYMKETEKLKRRIDLKAVLLTVLADDMKELVDEMTAMYQAHLKLLERMQLKAQADEFSASQQDKVAEEVKKIWMSAIRRFKKAINEQKDILRADLNLRLDRSSPKYRANDIQEKKDKLLKREIVMTEFIDVYCSDLKELLESEAKQDHIEINFTATEFNALTELLGEKYLKRGVKAEKALFHQLTAPGFQEVISKLEEDLNNQRASLRTTRHKQDQRLRNIMNTPLGPPYVDPYFDDLEIGQDSLTKSLEIQVDLSQTEQDHLKFNIMARLKLCEVLFKLKTLGQERKLKNELARKKVNFSGKKEALLTQDLTSNTSAKMVLKLKQEEKVIETAHARIVEDTKNKLSTDLQSIRRNLELLLKQRSERIREFQEISVEMGSKQERALNVLKSKLLDKVSTTDGDRLLQEYHINLEVLNEELQRLHQEQVLQQRLQSRKLEKLEETKKVLKEAVTSEPYRVGSAKRFAADCLVSLLMDVRFKQNQKNLDEYNTEEGDKLKSKLERRYYLNSKLALQLHERGMIVKLASALGISREDLEKELRNSMSESEDQSSSDNEAGLLLSKSILNLFDTGSN